MAKFDFQKLVKMYQVPAKLKQPSRVKLSSSTEKTLAVIWKKVLGLKNIGSDDNFFSLGGDSILAMQVVSQARQSNIPLRIRQIFANPILKDLAVNVMPKITFFPCNVSVEGEIPLTPIQHWFFNQAFFQPEQWCQVCVLKINVPVTIEKIQQGLKQLILLHDVLR